MDGIWFDFVFGYWSEWFVDDEEFVGFFLDCFGDFGVV